MANPDINVEPRPEKDRLRAFELFITSSTGGKPTSMRSIAADIGVSAVTIARWRETDKWDEKVVKLLSETTASAETTANALKRRVRQGLLQGLTQLLNLSMNADKDSDKIAAVKALADIAAKMDVLAAVATTGQGPQEKPVEFSDDLPNRAGEDDLASGTAGGGGMFPLTQADGDSLPVVSGNKTSDDGPGHGDPSVEYDGSLEAALERIEAGDEAVVLSPSDRPEGLDSDA